MSSPPVSPKPLLASEDSYDPPSSRAANVKQTLLIFFVLSLPFIFLVQSRLSKSQPLPGASFFTPSSPKSYVDQPLQPQIEHFANEFKFDEEENHPAKLLKKQVVFAADTEELKYFMCPIPKIGSSYHIGLMLRVLGEKDYEKMSIVHNMDYKLGLNAVRLGDETILEWYKDVDIPKYVVVRNPIFRTLSAYLDKVEQYLEENEKTAATFEAWVHTEFAAGTWENGRDIDDAWDVNPHWRPQSYFCGFMTKSLHTPFKIFHFEDPEPLVDYIYKFMPSRVLNDGWGRARNISLREFMLGPKKRSSGTEEKFLKYFSNIAVFDHLVNELKMDIESFGYSHEISMLRQQIKRSHEEKNDWYDDDE